MFAILAGLTHITALFLLVLLALILIDQKVKIKKVLIFGVLSSLGIITYMSLLFSKFNDPLAFITAQRSHGWLHLHGNYLTNIANNFNLINLIFIILLVLSVIYWWRKKWIFSVYSGLFLLIPLAGEFGGFDRYTLVAFPVQFMIYDKLKDKSLAYTLVIAFFSIIWAYTVMQYSGGYTGS